MLYEDLRFIHEDLERLEQAVADRVAENPANVSAACDSILTLCTDMSYFTLDPTTTSP